MNDIKKTALVSFLAVFVVVVAAGAVFGLFLDDEPSGASVADHVQLDNPQYDADRVSSDRSPGQADVDVDTHVFDNEVVIHLGGGLTERDVAPLINGIIESGNDVTVIAEEGPLGPGMPLFIEEGAVSQVAPPQEEPDQEESVLAGTLDDAHGFISLGVESYTDDDIDEIAGFVEDDGRIVMATDPTQEFTMGEGLSGVFSKLDVYTEPGYVFNLAENDLNYQRIFTEPEDASMLTQGVDRAIFDTATPVGAQMADEAMVPIEGSELSVTREETDKPVLVRTGDVALIGDTGFMKPENAQRADNDVLVGNIAAFLLEADRNVNGNANANEEDVEKTITVEVGPDGEPMFSPEVLEVEPGTTVEFEWGSDGHNIVPVYQEPSDADWDGVQEIQDEGFVHEHTFEEEGIHEFVSEPHQDEGMFGVIIVGEP